VLEGAAPRRRSRAKRGSGMRHLSWTVLNAAPRRRGRAKRGSSMRHLSWTVWAPLRGQDPGDVHSRIAGQGPLTPVATERRSPGRGKGQAAQKERPRGGAPGPGVQL